MSYQVIARKWRPQTFEEVTGQEAVTRTLRNAVEHDRLHHAYIFSGARGVGKTTTARLLAKAVNCHKTGDKPNPKPCSPGSPDACASCKEIAEGRSIDVLEIDAASHTGIDDVRDTIIDGINTNPARDRNKVFIIDEVHQLSKAAFNALLKTLEEPPPNVVFIMATTELHKVPDTILSRCQEFEFKTIALNKIFDRLKLIGDTEQINISEAALREIARAGEGSMRDAQSAFDQVISFSGEQIEVGDVVNALGIAGVDILLRTVRGIAEHSTIEAFEIVEELNRRGHDLRSYCRDLLSFFRDLLVAKVAGGSEGLLDWAAVSRDELAKTAEQFSEADLLRFFNSLADTEAQLRTANQPRYILEIGLVKLMEMRRIAPVEELLKKLAALEGGIEPTPANIRNAPAAAPQPPQSAAPVAAPEEKKTKFLDSLLEEAPFDTSYNPRPAGIEPVENTFVPSYEEDDYDVPFETFTPPAAEPVPVKTFDPPPFAASPAGFAAAAAPYIPAEDFLHFEDARLDSAYEQTLLRAGDDFAQKLDLDLSGIAVSPPPKFVPPPQNFADRPAAAPPPAAPPAAVAPKPQNGNGQPAKVLPRKPAAPDAARRVIDKIRIELDKKGKKWLAKCFTEISRLQVGETDIVIHLSEECRYWKDVLENEKNLLAVRAAALAVTGVDLAPVVRVYGEQVNFSLPAAAEIAKNNETPPENWSSAKADPVIKQVIDTFWGTIVEVRKNSSK